MLIYYTYDNVFNGYYPKQSPHRGVRLMWIVNASGWDGGDGKLGASSMWSPHAVDIK